ncbi:MAG: hypothetical protein A3B37_03675 [Candidatus Sungbacteria bacterium RIFCSPLOWO2_01_FULL_59_16]|uniref:Nucleotidyl transferase domain-containing protein n=1 Tax=Candidatus Sungbacteria bacterium RIFCSPLOWO2_01_FULL_59_16 TaxID=1802280 RepID=A0A1G2LC11_9BACT|nr:MAG: hypothetical protein A3B37_03675 [Candidatus Sungbacteria bacterium RIFCSPLOWO2_01_FULL_59_16]
MDVIILAGGRGTRLPISAHDIPKPLVEVHGKPMLEHQLERLSAHGFSKIRLALGYRADQVIAFLRERGYPHEYAVEPDVLGTGGAVRFAMGRDPGPFMVLNGDTLGDVDYAAVARSYRPGHSVLTAYWKDDARDFGLLHVQGGRIREFLEKPTEPHAGYVNAGCYVLESEHFKDAPSGAFMLEQALFPRLASDGRLLAYFHRGFFEDLGTEERLAAVRRGPKLW